MTKLEIRIAHSLYRGLGARIARVVCAAYFGSSSSASH